MQRALEPTKPARSLGAGNRRETRTTRHRNEGLQAKRGSRKARGTQPRRKSSQITISQENAAQKNLTVSSRRLPAVLSRDILSVCTARACLTLCDDLSLREQRRRCRVVGCGCMHAGSLSNGRRRGCLPVVVWRGGCADAGGDRGWRSCSSCRRCATFACCCCCVIWCSILRFGCFGLGLLLCDVGGSRRRRCRCVVSRWSRPFVVAVCVVMHGRRGPGEMQRNARERFHCPAGRGRSGRRCWRRRLLQRLRCASLCCLHGGRRRLHRCGLRRIHLAVGGRQRRIHRWGDDRSTAALRGAKSPVAAAVLAQAERDGLAQGNRQRRCVRCPVRVGCLPACGWAPPPTRGVGAGSCSEPRVRRRRTRSRRCSKRHKHNSCNRSDRRGLARTNATREQWGPTHAPPTRRGCCPATAS